MSVRDDLVAARALLDSPDKWTQGIMSSGECYCTMGAVGKATGQPKGGDRWSECDKVLRRFVPLTKWDPNVDGHPVVRFNDDPNTTHPDIMRLFDRAINAAKA